MRVATEAGRVRVRAEHARGTVASGGGLDRIAVVEEDPVVNGKDDDLECQPRQERKKDQDKPPVVDSHGAE